MAFRFEFDPVNKILLARFEGRATDQSLAEFYDAVRKYSTVTDASVGIWDLSSVTESTVSNELIRQLADQEPAMPDATRRPRFIVAPDTVIFGISRMFQIMGEHTRPLLEVVHTLDEVMAGLGIQSPHFEPLEWAHSGLFEPISSPRQNPPVLFSHSDIKIADARRDLRSLAGQLAKHGTWLTTARLRIELATVAEKRRPFSRDAPRAESQKAERETS